MRFCFLLTPFVLFSTLLFGCGPNSDTVTLTLIPSIGLQNRPFHQLEKEFFGMGTAMNTASFNLSTCRQIYMGAGAKVGEKENDLLTYPISLTSLVPNTPPSTYDAGWLAANTFWDKQIQVTVPKGRLVDVGIFGAFYEPKDTSPADGVCDHFGGSGIVNSYGLFGHTNNGFIANADLKVPLRVFIFPATPATTPYPVPTYSMGKLQSNAVNTSSCPANGFCCVNPDDNDTCPVRDLVDIYTTNPTYLKVLKIEYAFNLNKGPTVLHHTLPTAHIYAPSFFPMAVTVKYVSDNTIHTEIFFGEAGADREIASSGYFLKVKKVGL